MCVCVSVCGISSHNVCVCLFSCVCVAVFLKEGFQRILNFSKENPKEIYHWGIELRTDPSERYQAVECYHYTTWPMLKRALTQSPYGPKLADTNAGNPSELYAQ